MRQKSAASSKRSAPSSASISNANGIAAANGASCSARWQNAWIVWIAAWSNARSARRTRFAAVCGSSPRSGASVVSNRRAMNGSPPSSPVSSACASCARRARIRSCSSAVAAFVNVTTRISSAPRSFSSSRRTYSAQMFQVLPVPADASIWFTPSSGHANTSSSLADGPDGAT
ncbi:exodeoxyribonuclease V, beta subunit domain protein [Burkholderia pseudomallei]|nr:exodeoxyribonuclease V, beta subunit domain protein [Burkholderia pseudomallei]